jgi:hypothetical protein
MTRSNPNTDCLTKEEWDELVALKEAISYYPHSVSAQKMETFTELFVRSIQGRGDCVSLQTNK